METTQSRARNRFTIVERVNATAAANDPNVARAQATEVPLASYGQVSVYMKCYVDADKLYTALNACIASADGGYVE